jgi:predicted HTH domain antitoxin
MATVTIELPDGATPEQARLELACALYAQRRLSFGQARELAALHTWDFQQELGKRAIPPHYGVEDVDQDIATHEALGLW